MKNKILYICHGNFNYLSRAKRQINTLIENGYEVTVVNGIFRGDPIYNYPFRIEKLNISSGKSPLFNFLSLIRFNVGLIFKVKGNHNFIICRELSVLLSGVILKFFKSAKLIFDSNELSVETKTGLSKYFWGFIQCVLIQFCDTIFHAEKNRMEYFVKTYPIIFKNVEQKVIENFPYLNERQNILKTTNDIKAVYFGGVSEGRGIEQILMAFKDIPNCLLDIIGFGNENYYQKLNKILSDHKISNVSFLKPVNDEDIYESLTDYKIGFAFYENTNLNNYYCAPNKVYQYLQANLAIITNNYPGLTSVVQDQKIGLCIDDLNADEIINALKHIVNYKLWNNITQGMKEKYSWEYLSGIFVNIIRTTGYNE